MTRSSSLKSLCTAAVSASLLLILVGCSVQGQAQPESDDEKALYTIGLMIGQQLEQLALSDQELEYVFEGLKDQAQGNEHQVDADEQMERINAFMTERSRQGSAQSQEEGQAFREQFIEEGGTLTDSGLAYRIIEQGSGEKPSAEDTVEVHYEGQLIDGTVFDSSYTRGETVTFPLNRVIAGWTEGLQLIAPGGKIQLVIPPELGYGDQGAPPTIPGGATLVFEVELIDIK